MYREQSLETFLAELAARTPTPGGGGASAVGGALGAGLAGMSAAFTSGERYRKQEAAALKLRKRFDELRERLLQLAEEDALAYEAWMAARRLPKDGKDAAAVRKKAVATAQEKATRVPEEILKRCSEALAAAAKLAPICNPNLVADVASGAYLLEAAARGVCLQVAGNLGGQGGKGAKRLARARRQLADCVKLCGRIERMVVKALRK